jgi:hypothetical protein
VERCLASRGRETARTAALFPLESLPHGLLYYGHHQDRVWSICIRKAARPGALWCHFIEDGNSFGNLKDFSSSPLLWRAPSRAFLEAPSEARAWAGLRGPRLGARRSVAVVGQSSPSSGANAAQRACTPAPRLGRTPSVLQPLFAADAHQGEAQARSAQARCCGARVGPGRAPPLRHALGAPCRCVSLRSVR